MQYRLGGPGKQWLRVVEHPKPVEQCKLFLENSMHEQDVNTAIFNAQANNAVNTTIVNDMRQLSFDIENFASDATILIDTIFETIDGLATVPATLQRPVNAINCFATCVKRHLILIAEANDKIRHIASSEVSQ